MLLVFGGGNGVLKEALMKDVDGVGGGVRVERSGDMGLRKLETCVCVE